MSWLKKNIPKKIKTTLAFKENLIPDGIWSKCKHCHSMLYQEELRENLFVCPKCQYHHRLSAKYRLELYFDDQDYQEIAIDIKARDPLKFCDSKKYLDRLSEAIATSTQEEALIVARGKFNGIPVVIAAFNFDFMGGSMGSAVGEKFVQGVQEALKNQCSFICFCASGGARMQEGLISLMQMAKTASILNQLSQAKLLFISVLTDPTMGGVSASLAMLGDIIIAEPKALIGFAGPRVIEQTVRQKLPPGFQLSEFLLTHGAIDAVVDRRQLKDYLAELLKKFQGEKI